MNISPYLASGALKIASAKSMKSPPRFGMSVDENLVAVHCLLKNLKAQNIPVLGIDIPESRSRNQDSVPASWTLYLHPRLQYVKPSVLDHLTSIDRRHATTHQAYLKSPQGRQDSQCGNTKDRVKLAVDRQKGDAFDYEYPFEDSWGEALVRARVTLRYALPHDVPAPAKRLPERACRHLGNPASDANLDRPVLALTWDGRST